MASIKKKPKLNLPEVIQRVSKDTIDYSESLNNPSWDNERKWADEIMKSIRSYGLKFHLDKLTRGKGSCFFVAVLQQMNRRKIIIEATDEGEDLARSMDSQILRKKVVEMLRTSRNPKIIEIKNDYNMARTVIKVPPMPPWDNYLQHMLKETTWADTYLIRAIALLLEMNIQIIDTAPGRRPHRYTYNGDPNPDSFDEARETLYIGVSNNTHFQSLLPDEAVEEESEEEAPDSQVLKEVEQAEGDDKSEKTKIAKDNNASEADKETVDNKCPSCRNSYKNLLLHIKKSKRCQVSDQDIMKLESKSKTIKKERHRKESERSRAKLKNQDPEREKLRKRQYQSTWETKKERRGFGSPLYVYL